MFGKVPESFKFEISDLRELNEIMDLALKKISKKVSSGGAAVFEFTMKGNTPKMNEYPIDVNYTVNFSRAEKITYNIRRPDIFGIDSLPVRLLVSDLTFKNDVSNMSELSSYMKTFYDYDPNTTFNAMAVLSTVGRIFLDYLNSMPQSVSQAVSFSTAGDWLVKPYLILTDIAEKRHGVVKAEPKRWQGQYHENFLLLGPSTVTTLLSEIKKRQE